MDMMIGGGRGGGGMRFCDGGIVLHVQDTKTVLFQAIITNNNTAEKTDERISMKTSRDVISCFCIAKKQLV